MSNDEEFQILNKSSKFKKQILKENYQLLRKFANFRKMLKILKKNYQLLRKFANLIRKT